MKTPLRAVRVPDHLWQRALAIAKERDESLSDIMRDALELYVEDYGHDAESLEVLRRHGDAMDAALNRAADESF